MSPTEVEEELRGYEGIADVSVVGLPHSRGGEEVVAAVIMKPGTPFDEDAIRAFARSTMTPYKVPRRVFEVDERKQRDRNVRLQKLFLQPSKSSVAQADKIVKESARYNIGNIQRTINVPTLALVYLANDYQARMSFTDEKEEDDETLHGEWHSLCVTTSK